MACTPSRSPSGSNARAGTPSSAATAVGSRRPAPRSHAKLSGAVGVFGTGDPAVEAAVCARLGLKPEPIATQVVPRDRHAVFFATLAVLGGALERIATEIRHLQRTEVGEALEPFGRGQKGSSAMPHKRNPWMAENVCGLARLLRGYAGAALENIA